MRCSTHVGVCCSVCTLTCTPTGVPLQLAHTCLQTPNPPTKRNTLARAAGAARCTPAAAEHQSECALVCYNAHVGECCSVRTLAHVGVVRLQRVHTCLRTLESRCSLRTDMRTHSGVPQELAHACLHTLKCDCMLRTPACIHWSAAAVYACLPTHIGVQLQRVHHTRLCLLAD